MAPLGPASEVNTWHHHQNLRTMQEVPQKIHARFTHYGARSIIKNKQLNVHKSRYKVRKRRK
ncbi:HNH endonuclease [Cytophagaceae bacterium ABcell3]|nr:HNH endonuclease [Cytophagaceae bacterium ABcell3]